MNGDPIVLSEHQDMVNHYYDLVFTALDREQDGDFAFPCDANGSLFEQPALAVANMLTCLLAPDRWRNDGVRHTQGKYVIAATIQCVVCGATVSLDDSFASGCPGCETEYNGSGQKLAPRRFWGEETGEHF